MLILTLMLISIVCMFIAVFFVKEPKEVIAVLMAFVLGLGFSMNVNAYENHKAEDKVPVVFEWR